MAGGKRTDAATLNEPVSYTTKRTLTCEAAIACWALVPWKGKIFPQKPVDSRAGELAERLHHMTLSNLRLYRFVWVLKGPLKAGASRLGPLPGRRWNLKGLGHHRRS